MDAVTHALTSIREVYGIRRLTFDRAANTLRVEYDAPGSMPLPDKAGA